MLYIILGGSWLVISGVVWRVTIIRTHIRGLIPPLITAHEPPRFLGITSFAHNNESAPKLPFRLRQREPKIPNCKNVKYPILYYRGLNN